MGPIHLGTVVLALGVALCGLWRGTERHGPRGALLLGGVGAGLLVVGISLYPLVYAGAAAMLGAAVWNTAVLGRAHG